VLVAARALNTLRHRHSGMPLHAVCGNKRRQRVARSPREIMPQRAWSNGVMLAANAAASRNATDEPRYGNERELCV